MPALEADNATRIQQCVTTYHTSNAMMLLEAKLTVWVDLFFTAGCQFVTLVLYVVLLGVK